MPPWAVRPRRAPGLEDLGEFTGSGLRGRRFLVRRADGAVVQLTELLYLLLAALDGEASVEAVAAAVRASSGRPVSPDNVRYLLNTRLVPLGLVVAAAPPSAATAATTPAGPAPTLAPKPAPTLAPKPAPTLAPKPATPLLGLAATRTLLTPRATKGVGRALAPLFHPVAVTVVLVALVGVDAWVIRSSGVTSGFRGLLTSPSLILLALGLTLASMVFHEFGHAAACRYGGARPGVIGCGVYLLWPALYTDVTDSYRLGRAGRLRTDLGGVYFNMIFVLALAAASAMTGSHALVVVIVLVHLEAAEQLIPVVRFDGYFILSDLAGVPDLFNRMGPVLRASWARVRDGLGPGGRHAPPSARRPPDPRVDGLTPRARAIVTGWVAVVAPLLAANLVMLLVFAPDILATIADASWAQWDATRQAVSAGAVTAAVASGVSFVLVALPGAGIAVMFARLGQRATGAARAFARDSWARTALAAVLIAGAGAALAGCWLWRGV